jgi:hypothetical protein
MYDRDGGGGRSATPTGFAFVWITCLCHVWSVWLLEFWIRGGGQGRPECCGCGALEVEIIWERMQLWRLGGALRAAAPQRVPRGAQTLILIFGGTECKTECHSPARFTVCHSPRRLTCVSACTLYIPPLHIH